MTGNKRGERPRNRNAAQGKRSPSTIGRFAKRTDASPVVVHDQMTITPWPDGLANNVISPGRLGVTYALLVSDVNNGATGASL